MPRSFSIALITAGLAAVIISLACSDSVAPSRGLAIDTRQASSAPTLTPQNSGTSFRFFAVSPVNARVVWASAAGGTFALTTDGGANWTSRQVPGAGALQFRDVEGVSAKVAYLLSAGTGLANRIYKTEDGGNTWTLQFQAPDDERYFYDCFDFWTPRRGITFADNVGGRFPVIKTTDGEHWRDIGGRLPPAQEGEAGFAASGTCVATLGGQRAWIGTGGAPDARVFRTTDGGNTWKVSTAPVTHGTGTSGVVSIAFRDHSHGILGGGDVVASTTPQDNVARSNDGGKTWRLTTPTPFPGAVYGLTYVPGGQKRTVVATGPSGAAWTPDEGNTWSLLPGVTDFWAVAFASREAGWLVGGQGKILKVSFRNNGNSGDHRGRNSNHDDGDD